MPRSSSQREVEEVAPATSMADKIVAKKKAVLVETEPSHTVLSGSSIALDLVVSSNCNYAKYTCATDRVYFKDTFMFQTRLYRFVCHFIYYNIIIYYYL